MSKAFPQQDDPMDRALDSALSRALQPPAAPPALRARLRAAMEQAAVTNIPEVRRRLEREHREEIEALTRQYVRLRRRTLSIMVGGAFAAGAAAAVALPWLTANFGPIAPSLIAGVSAIASIGIGISYWQAWRRERNFWAP